MNTFLFITAFIISLIVIIVFLKEIESDNKTKPSEFVLNMQSIVRGITVFMVSLAITDKFGLINFGMYSGTYTFIGVVCMAVYLLCIINSKRRIPLISFAVKTILIAFVLELTVFNVPSYRMWFGDYKTTTYEASRSILDKGGIYRRAQKDIVVRGGDEVVLTLHDLNRQVSTVYVDIALDARAVDFSIDATDETQTKIPRSGIAKTIISRNRMQTQYLQCELSGNVGDLKVRLKPQNSGTAYIRSVTINMPVMFEISWIRFLLIVLLTVFIHAVIKGRFMQRSLNENLKFCRIAVACVTVTACIWAIWETNYRIDDKTWKEEFTKKEGSQVTQQLVDAFEDGRTYLLEAPDDALNSFDNPYDKRQREAELVPSWEGDYYYTYAWDHVYFDGKFYSYYGIAPVVLLFLPYHLITGYYFPESAAVLIFSLIGIIGLSFLFIKFIRKFFPTIPTGIFIISLIIIQMVSGIWYSIGRPLFYEVAMSSGFAFMTWAFYFLISANIIGNGKISLSKTAVSSFLFAVAVLCRPTTVLYCICAFIFMICAMPRFSYGNKKLFNKKSIRYLLCAVVPMACIGTIQMCYNYARFNSPFEFGIQYSLTINDFRNTQFHWRLSLIPFWNYLFNAPVFSTKYPFVSANFQDMSVGGFFYNDYPSTHNVCGLFFLALPMFSYFLSGKAMKTIPDKRARIKKSLYLAFPCVIIPLIIICSVWESGYAVRYMADFAWQMLIGAYVIIFMIYVKTKNPTVRKMVNIFFCFSLVWTIYVSGIQSVNQTFRYCESHLDYPEIAYEIEKIILFWK